MDTATRTPYEQLGGEMVVRSLVEHFYDHMERDPDVVDIRAMHEPDLSPMREKLFEYLSGWMGGPSLYRIRTGTICLTEPHAPYAIGETERDQWLLCMDRALADVGADAALREMLSQPLFRIADIMRNR